MQNNKLLPCPFCGGEAFRGCFPTDYPTEHCQAYVQCRECGAEVHRYGNVKNAKKLLSEAMENWNTRKPMERIVEQLEEQRNTTICKMNNEPYGNQVQMWYRTGVRDAIDIVKGGVDNAE